MRKRVLVERLARGEIVTIELEDADNENGAWREQAECFRDDPTFDEFLAEMQRERRELDREEPAA